MPPGTEAKRGETLYGVFLQACNREGGTHQTADRFKIVDNQGNEFEPEPLPEDNHFAYHPQQLEKDECIPEAGSVAQLGPDGRLHAAVQAAAREHRVPPAGARDPRYRARHHLHASTLDI